MLFRTLLCLALAVTFGNSQAAETKSGEELYRQHCAACHGYDGNGGVGVPLTLPDFQYSVTNNYLKKTIRHGRPGRVMPAFPSLSNAEIKALNTFVAGHPVSPTATRSRRYRGTSNTVSNSISNTARPVMAQMARAVKEPA